jgi:RNA polymerase sigma factor (sigma-70 family)
MPMGNEKCSLELQFTTGDQAAFTILFNHFYKPLCWFAFNKVRQWSHAEEIAGEAFIKLWEKGGNFQSTGAIKKWLYKCTYNQCLNYIQQCKRQVSFSVDILTYDNKLTHIIQNETLQEVYSLIETLPPKCKSIFELYYVAGFDNNQIAKLFNVSISTVKNQRARGIFLVKKRLINIHSKP